MSLVSKSFQVPEKFETAKFRLRMLTINDVVKDYDAVMTSINHLQGVFGEFSTWPSTDLSFEQDLIDLGWDQKEFQRRTSFTYTVMALDESICLGAVYIYPSIKENIEAEIYLWVRRSEYEKGLDARLEKTVRDWIQAVWPFNHISYPGRESNEV